MSLHEFKLENTEPTICLPLLVNETYFQLISL